jgi:hypothetical protein
MPWCCAPARAHCGKFHSGHATPRVASAAETSRAIYTFLLTRRAGRASVSLQSGKDFTMPPRMRIVWTTLARALDCQDDYVVRACRRLIVADRLGWRKHRDTRDWEVVQACYTEGGAWLA